MLKPAFTHLEKSELNLTVILISKLAPPELKADRNLLEQAVWNVLDNGVKYSERKAAVRVHGGSQKGRFYLAVVNRGAIILPH